jgi:hypothetical protein
VVCALSKAQLQDGYVSYPWEKKMSESLPIPNSSSFLSMLILPAALDRAGFRYNTVEDTLARANAWILSSQASGVPITFSNVQTEALLTKVLKMPKYCSDVLVLWAPFLTIWRSCCRSPATQPRQLSTQGHWLTFRTSPTPAFTGSRIITVSTSAW